MTVDRGGSQRRWVNPSPCTPVQICATFNEGAQDSDESRHTLDLAARWTWSCLDMVCRSTTWTS